MNKLIKKIGIVLLLILLTGCGIVSDNLEVEKSSKKKSTPPAVITTPSSLLVVKNDTTNRGNVVVSANSIVKVSDNIKVTATAKDGFYFDYYLVNTEIVTSNPLELVIDKATTISVIFTPNAPIPQYPINSSTVGNGSISFTPNKATYDEGETVEVTAVADSGYRFLKWSGADNSTNNPITLTMATTKNITAEFVKVHTLSTNVLPIEAGNATPSSNIYYDTNDTVILSYTNNTSLDTDNIYKFSHWSITDINGNPLPYNGNSSNNLSITITTDTIITAVFDSLLVGDSIYNASNEFYAIYGGRCPHDPTKAIVIDKNYQTNNNAKSNFATAELALTNRNEAGYLNAGYTDWEIPTIEQLEKITPYVLAGTIINPTFVNMDHQSQYLSRTPLPANPDNANINYIYVKPSFTEQYPYILSRRQAALRTTYSGYRIFFRNVPIDSLI